MFCYRKIGMINCEMGPYIPIGQNWDEMDENESVMKQGYRFEEKIKTFLGSLLHEVWNIGQNLVILLYVSPMFK